MRFSIVVLQRIRTALVFAAGLAMAGCFELPEEGSSSGGSPDTSSGSGSSTAASIPVNNPSSNPPVSNPPVSPPASPTPPSTPTVLSGALTLKMAGVPLDTAEHLYVQVSGVEVNGANGNITTAIGPRRIDLMALGGSQTETLLNDSSLPAGRYDGLRLVVDSSAPRDTYIVVQGGGEQELVISSGDQSRLQVNQGFDVPANGRADMTLVLDLRRSVRQSGGDYRLTPYLRLVNNANAGSIGGTVNPALVPGTCSPAVYIFSGSVTPDDIDGNSVEPISTAVVKLDNGGTYRYRASFLEPGRYTVSYTCRAAQDRPDGGDALNFSGTVGITVSNQAETTHNFDNNNTLANDDDDDRKGRGKG